mmetsp:Transcript_71318/g.195463  ORF Transcript_71318/g.195463 Transcript_71318/m.195463 type:complete len:222 (+) Transcript_71318:975-1640(+)
MLSNSSMQQSPPSASTSAPASSIHSPPASRTAVHVSPADVEPMPVVSTARGLSLAAYRSTCDLPVPASPTSSMCDSPRTFMPVASVWPTPPSSVSAMPSLTRNMPLRPGHMRVSSQSRAASGASRLLAQKSSNSAMSSLDTRSAPASSLRTRTCCASIAISTSQRTSFWSGRQRLRSTPTTVTSSPALAASTRSFCSSSEMERGIEPTISRWTCSWMRTSW